MTLQQWLDSVNGKFIDIDGKYGAQCVDLMRHYLKYCLGLDPYVIPATDYAKNIFKNYPEKTDYFVKIKNGPNNFPNPGDIVFFDTYPFLYGWAGHVAVISYAEVMFLISMDQNYPTGSACKLTKHSYRGCLGWLSPVKK